MNKDLFSTQSDIYAKYRPGYPPELLVYILQYVSGRKIAWDCATGNGQAAVLLSPFFEMVEATDVSERQITNSIPVTNIHYSVSRAENTSFADDTFNLITVAQAYHWFDFMAFEKEVKRVLKRDGIIAIWGYGLVQCDYDELNSIIHSFYRNTVGPYWDPERKYVDDHYRTVPFPYDQLPAKEFFIEQKWSLQEMLGYLNTWSSVQRFIKAKKVNPVDPLETELQKSWPSNSAVVFRFPLFLRIGKVR